MGKRGPKPKYGKSRTEVIGISVTEDQKQLINAAGTADQYLNILMAIAVAKFHPDDYKSVYRGGSIIIDPETLEVKPYFYEVPDEKKETG